MGNVFGALLSGAYGLAWTAACPFLRRHKRLKDGFASRLVPNDWSGPVDIWLQAASGGEAYLVWELLRQLAVLREEEGCAEPLRVLATTWTRQGLETLQTMTKQLQEEHPWLSVRATFFPLDAPGLMAKALEQARPRVVGLLETELWPGLMLACRKHKIPFVILNGRMTGKSLRNYLKLDAVAPDFWKAIPPEHVCAISREDAARFARLFGRERVETVPNIKFDRAAAGAKTAVSESLQTLLPAGEHAGRALLASVREEEEPAILAVVQRLYANKTSVIIAPRHLHRVKAWQALLSSAQIPFLLRSKQKTTIAAGTVVIWDSFGELGQLYQLADAVFVGGSLAPLGGQNFLEPLALGKSPCTGPHLDNFAWALEATEDGSDSLEALGLLRRGANASAIAACLQERLLVPENPEAVRERFQDWLRPRLGGAARCARELMRVSFVKGN